MPKGHVFISYRHEDLAKAEWLQVKLARAGINVWMDKAAMRPGDYWETEIRHAITAGTLVFLACFSGASLALKQSSADQRKRGGQRSSNQSTATAREIAAGLADAASGRSPPVTTIVACST